MHSIALKTSKILQRIIHPFHYIQIHTSKQSIEQRNQGILNQAPSEFQPTFLPSIHLDFSLVVILPSIHPCSLRKPRCNSTYPSIHPSVRLQHSSPHWKRKTNEKTRLGAARLQAGTAFIRSVKQGVLLFVLFLLLLLLRIAWHIISSTHLSRLTYSSCTAPTLLSIFMPLFFFPNFNMLNLFLTPFAILFSTFTTSASLITSILLEELLLLC